MKFLDNMAKQSPEAMVKFQAFMNESLKEGKLSVKQKELIALGIAINKQCRSCIDIHVGKAKKAGASKQELLETCWVAVLMGGGPALMYCEGVIDKL